MADEEANDSPAEVAAREADRAGESAESLRERAAAVRAALDRFETDGDPREDTDLDAVLRRLDRWETGERDAADGGTEREDGDSG